MSNSGKGTYWTTAVDAELVPHVGTEGVAAAKPDTVMSVFQATKDRVPNKTALRVKRGGEWKEWTWGKYYDDVIRAARSMICMGLQPFQAVSIIGFNSPEWFIADVAAIACGGVACGIYSTNEPKACQYIADNSNSAIVFVEDDTQLQKFLKIRHELPKLRAIVQWTGTPKNAPAGVYSWTDFMKLADEVEESEVHERIAASRPGHCSTLIYTSGTTGPPKGVMISHDNATWTAECVCQVAGLGHEEQTISYLPLSHIAAQMLDIHAPMKYGTTVTFAQADALRGSLGQTMKEVRPTCFFGVPRVWEKIEEKIKAAGAQTTGLKKSIGSWAKAKGLAAVKSAEKGSKSTPFMFGLAKSLALDKVRDVLGLDRCRVCLTGAAPISHETLEYFASLYIPILEIFGMSESTGPITVSNPKVFKLGYTGPPIPGMEFRLANKDKEGNGEIQFRGRNAFMGYLGNDKATSETISSDGWVSSGDLGAVDERGILKITGRIKELIVTAGGENIPPVLIENELKEELPAVSNAMVVGDKRKYLTVLFTLKTDVGEDGLPNDVLTGEALKVPKSEAKTVSEAQKSEAWTAYLDAGIKRANERATSNAQKVQKFKILPHEFRVGDELTPTLKLMRRIVMQKYEKEIESLY